MSDYRDGDKGPGPCGYCNKVVPTTFANVALSLCEGLEEVENCLVMVCVECGNMIGIPAQSLPHFNKHTKNLLNQEQL